MLRLFQRRSSRNAPAPFPAPVHDDGVIFAIGDVHGREDLLTRLVDRIMQEVAGSDEKTKLVFLGDYIDRGESARGTINLLIELAQQEDVETVFLMGNHEQMMLRFLRDPMSGSRWLRFGGMDTLMSYGVGTTGNLRSEDEAQRIRGALIEALGPHLTFIEGLRLSHHSGNLFFCHAGADPGVPTDEQDERILLWGCERFRKSDRGDGVWVVHGHFVGEQPTAEHGRISVDTGAYFSGRLTAARISSGEVTFLEG